MGILTSLSQGLNGGETANTKRCFLAEMSDSGSPVPGSTRAVQFFPETISDSRSVQYEEKTMMGSSHPIYQWVHGSDRIISFEAHFASDTPAVNSGVIGDPLSTASSILKNPVAGIIAATKGPGSNAAVDIAKAIAWLRSYTYPSYPGSGVVKAPPKLLLYLEGTQIYSFVGTHTTSVIPVILRRCDVTYESFFRNGSIRSAMVSLEFAETIQVGNSWGYVDRTPISRYAMVDNGYTYGKDGVLPSGDSRPKSTVSKVLKLFNN